MNQPAPQTEPQNSPPPAAADVVSKPSILDQAIENTKFTDPTSYLMDVKAFDQIQRIARMYERSSLIPEHLRCFDFEEKYDEAGTIANVSLVIMQAFRWNIDPFVAMAHSYELRGRLGYEGKLVAAIVNTRSGIIGRLRYRHEGEGRDRRVIVSGRFRGETEDRVVELVYRDAVTRDKNGKEKEAWTRDPDQKLCYGGATKWARRHCPEVIAGVYIEDDLDRIEASEHIPSEGTTGLSGGHETEQPEEKPKSRGDQLLGSAPKTVKTSETPDQEPPQEKPSKPSGQSSAATSANTKKAKSKKDSRPNAQSGSAKKDPETATDPMPPGCDVPPGCPEFPAHLYDIVVAMCQAKDSTELQQIIGSKTSPESKDFDAILTVGDWLRDTGHVKPPRDPRQGQMFDRTKQPD